MELTKSLLTIFTAPPRSPQEAPPYRDLPVRVFVALFDYDPVSMSPNPDAGEEELPFREGQLLKVTILPCGARAPVSSQNLLRTSSCIGLREAQRVWLSRAGWLDLVGPCFCPCSYE